MKKNTLYFAIACVLFSACAKELDSPVSESTPRMVEITLSASMEPSTDADTKAIVGDDGKFSWSDSDQIAVHTTKGNLVTLTASGAGTTTTFTGTILEGDSVADGAFAYYPASIAVAGSPEKVNLPDTYATAEAARKGFPMRATVTDGSLTFQHMGAIMKISTTYLRDEINQVVVTLPATVTGEFDVDDSGAAPVVNAVSGTASSITISLTDVSRASGNGEATFYFPLPTGSYNGMALSFQNSTLGIFGEKSTTKTITLGRAHMMRMASFVVPGYYLSQAFKYADVNYNAANTYAMFKESAGSEWYVAKDIATDTYANSRFYMLVNGTDASDGAAAATTPVCYGATTDPKPNITVGTITTANANTKRNGTTPFNLSAKDTAYGSNVDACLNPSRTQVLFATSGSVPEYRTICFTTDLDLPDQTYRLHVWGAAAVTSWNNLPTASIVTIGGIKYYSFTFLKSELIDGNYKFIFRHNDDYRFDFRNNNLVVDSSSDTYYIFFTSVAHTGYTSDNNQSHNQNFSYQYTNPAYPEGTSKYLVRVGDTNYSNFEWESGKLVAHNIAITAGSEVKISFNGSGDDFYGYASASTTFTDGTWYDVTNSNPNAFGVSADGIYDVYFDFVNKKAKVVKVASADPLKLLFKLPSTQSNVYAYVWDASNNKLAGDFPGTEITSNAESKGGDTYYYYEFPYTDLDKNYKIIISDGVGANNGGWQTANYGYLYLSHELDDLYFSIDSEGRILPETDENVTITVNLDSDLQAKFTSWAYLHYWVSGKASFLEWPGQKSIEETASSSYTFTLPAKHVWGQTLGLILNNKGDAGGDWQSSDWYGADFSVMKSSYTFNATSSGLSQVD